MAGDRVHVGVVGPPHGVHGDVYVHPDADLEAALQPGQRLHAHAEGFEDRTLEVARVREHKGRVLVGFVEVTDRDAALALRGARLELSRDAADQLDIGGEAGEEPPLWVDELLGCEAVDERGELLGVVERVEDGPAHDWLVLARTDGAEFRVPLVADLVDVTDEQLVVRPLPGLLDDDWV